MLKMDLVDPVRTGIPIAPLLAARPSSHGGLLHLRHVHLGARRPRLRAILGPSPGPRTSLWTSTSYEVIDNFVRFKVIKE